MPKLNNDNAMEVLKAAGPGNVQFSAVRPDALGATEYTLVTLAVDRSGSVRGFSNDIVQMLNAVLKACALSPRAENIMIRLLTFNDRLQEVHGFKPLSLIDGTEYQTLSCGGETALFDATYSALSATLTYAGKLTRRDYAINGIIFVLTDGEDNASSCNPTQISNYADLVVTGEEIESLLTILIGINTANCRQKLQGFKDEANLSHFIDAGDATPGKLAKLAQFLSRSIVSQSQSLRTGKAAQDMTF
jgi:uncharacterized protein YegL